MSKEFHPDINMKLKTASNTITPTLLSKNQMKKAATDDNTIDVPGWTRNCKFKCMIGR